MKPREELLSSLDRSWSEFSKTWSKTRHKAFERSVHNLPVNTRRLIASLELARVLSKRNDISQLQRRFKKVLKGMSVLRDLQVQLKTVSQVRKSQPIVDFTHRLERLERREIEKVPKELKGRKKRRLENAFKDLRSEFVQFQQGVDRETAHPSLMRILSQRRQQFLKEKRRFKRSEPPNEDALHAMRIALKKLRYVMEAAQPVLGEAEKERSQAMRAVQKVMGDSRDIEILRDKLEQWAKRKGNKVAVIPALQQLEEKRAELLQKVRESSDQLESMLDVKSSSPLTETTQLVASAAALRTPLLS